MPALLPIDASSGRQYFLTLRMNSSAYPQNYLSTLGLSRIFKHRSGAYSFSVNWSGMFLLLAGKRNVAQGVTSE